MPALVTLMLLTLTCRVTPDTTSLPKEDSTSITCATGTQFTITQNKVNAREYYWNNHIPSALHITNHSTQEKTLIAQTNKSLFIHAKVSPTEQYVTYYDTDQQCFYIYNTKTSTLHSLNKNILSIDKWLPQDTAFIAYDKFDIYKINPQNNTSTSLTHNYGKNNHIILRLLSDSILVAFNTRNKQNGFYKLTSSQPILLSMCDCLYYFPVYPLDGFKPTRQNNTWLLQKQTASQPPINYTTTDFITFTQQAPPPSPTFTATLLHFNNVTGILYTPINYNPNIKYPLILTYYLKSSDNLHKYQKQQPSEGTLNIPTYIANGYIIFVPDLKTKKGHPGPSTAKTIIKSAKKLRKYSTSIGLQGYSFGGYITNYVITHSHLFAAANESAGIVNLISGYGSLKRGTDISLQPLYERGQNNMWATPWEKPKLYIRNSPIFKVDKITTPLLMLHNENDYIVPYAQAVELFTALRRLQKPVWWLQYKEEGHQLFRLENQLDFTQHQLEFFNHFLKGTPAPAWMHTSPPGPQY